MSDQNQENFIPKVFVNRRTFAFDRHSGPISSKPCSNSSCFARKLAWLSSRSGQQESNAKVLRIKQNFHLVIVGFLSIHLTLVPMSHAKDPERPHKKNNIKHRVEILSKTHTFDRIYKSMTGLVDNQEVFFLDSEKRELLWLTGFKVEIIDPVTHATKSQEYLCHSHLKFNPDTFDIRKRDKAFGPNTSQDVKSVTLIQGKTKIDLPPDFGVPIFSDEPFIFHSMVINNNATDKPFELKTKATFSFIRDKELIVPIKPLFRRCLTLRVPVDPASKNNPSCHSVEEDSEIATELAEPVQSTGGNVRTNKEGQEDSYHWLVPPGRHQYRYVLPKGLELPFDTTAHHISIHVHPYGKYMELRDVTMGKTVFKSRVKNYTNRIGIAHSQDYSGVKGIEVFKDHRYELICRYENPTANDIDAMAVIYLYLFNKSFDKNSLE